jgi:hypothetical protein
MSTTPWTVGYASDLEGSYSYWRRYIEQSSVLFTTDGHDVKLRDNCYFVCGGDVCDRGDGDIRILTDLLALKDEYKERVQFILGNRDVNKLRLPFSLHEKALEEDPVCFWVDPKNAQEFATEKTRAGRLRWILKNTMGSPWSFECRKEELAALGRDTSDEAVAQSYLDLISAPNGLLFRYINEGKMAVIIGDAIFVHGGLVDSHLGYVPPTFTHRSEYCTNPLEWVHTINAFKNSEIQDFISRTEGYLQEENGNVKEGWDKVGNYAHPQPGSRLVQCGMGTLADNSPNPTVIYTNFMQSGLFSHLQPRVTSWLRPYHINKVIVGHQPAGDCVAILPNVDDMSGVRTYAISADTCYSSFVQYDMHIVNQLLTKEGVEELNLMEKMIVSVRKGHEDWKSVTPYLRDKGLLSPLPGVASANDKADTRAPLCVAEPTVVFQGSPRLVVANNEMVTTEGVPVEGKVVLKGVLASGHVHGVTLPEEDGDVVVGKEIGNGWVIRSRGIYPSHHPLFLSSSTAATATATAVVEEEEEEWCVAGFCEKTTFRSHLLPVRIAKELIKEVAAASTAAENK